MRTSAASSRKARRRGAVLVLITVMIVAVVGFVALGVDVGYVAAVRTELKRSTDAGALAGAGRWSKVPTWQLPACTISSAATR